MPREREEKTPEQKEESRQHALQILTNDNYKSIRDLAITYRVNDREYGDKGVEAVDSVLYAQAMGSELYSSYMRQAFKESGDGERLSGVATEKGIVKMADSDIRANFSNLTVADAARLAGYSGDVKKYAGKYVNEVRDIKIKIKDGEREREVQLDRLLYSSYIDNLVSAGVRESLEKVEKARAGGLEEILDPAGWKKKIEEARAA